MSVSQGSDAPTRSTVRSVTSGSQNRSSPKEADRQYTCMRVDARTWRAGYIMMRTQHHSTQRALPVAWRLSSLAVLGRRLIPYDITQILKAGPRVPDCANLQLHLDVRQQCPSDGGAAQHQRWSKVCQFERNARACDHVSSCQCVRAANPCRGLLLQCAQ